MAHRYGAVARLVLLALAVAARPESRVAAGPETMWHVVGAGQGTPAVDERSAYFLSRGHEIVAIERATGHVRWRSPLGLDQTATAGSRIVAAGNVVVAGGHDLVALDRASGTRRWSFARDNSYGFGFYLGDAASEVVYTGSASGELWAFNANAGLPLWSSRIGGTETTVYAPATDRADVVASFTDFGASGQRGIVLLDSRTGRERWRVSLPSSRPGDRPPAIGGGPLIVGARVIVSGHDGSIHALSRSTGAPLWSTPEPADNPRAPDFRPLARSGDVVLAGSLSGEVAALDAGNGREIWRRRPSEASVAFSLAAGRDSVYVPYVSGTLVALAIHDGHERWRIGGPAGGLRWAPRVDGTLLFMAGSSSGYLGIRDRIDRERG